MKVKLNGKGKRLLKKRKSASVALRLTPKGGTPINTTVTLKRK